MAKILRCSDVMPGCKTVLEGKDEAEVIARSTTHLKNDHKLLTIPPDVATKAKAAIKEK